MKILSSFLPALGLAILFPHFSSADETANQLPNWVWSKSEPASEDSIILRKRFEIPATTKRVILIASGDNQIRVHLNGSARPISSLNWSEPLVEDISDRVAFGEENVLGALVTNEGGIAGAFVLIEMIDESGEKSRIVTGDDWQVSEKLVKGWFGKGFAPKEGFWSPARVIKSFGAAPWQKINETRLAELLDLRIPEATPVESIRLVEGFEAELLYSVPKPKEGSWVAMTIDDQERLIVSDQYGALYRVAIPDSGETVDPASVEKIEVNVGNAQGLLYAFDSLYVVQSTSEKGGRGLYRVTDSDGDDRFDTKKMLRKLPEFGGEHGPHAVVLGPDGESIYVVVGNQTPITDFDTSKVPEVWGEDLLLERPIGKGFMKGTLAPGGWIAKTDPAGKSWELISTGFRNQYDIAFNQLGDLFTYDADMEWDMNTPWYRPTRINLVTSGSEFGWRYGGGKWPAYYPDSLPAVVDIGPGSPTGVAFGYGAAFPAKYQTAFYAADWSYGKLYAVHLEPDGAGYKASFEEFMSAQPLPLTDLLVNPKDGAMYVAIGGRRVQSGLYRITYTGAEKTDLVAAPHPTELHTLRKTLESMHEEKAGAVDEIWPRLGSSDRWIRFAARTALEHQPIEQWQERVFIEDDSETTINSAIALARHGDRELHSALLEKLNLVSEGDLSSRQQLDLLRAYGLVFTRMGKGAEKDRTALAERIIARMPFPTPEHNIEALELAVYLEAPAATEIGIGLLNEAPSQEEQMAYAKSLRHQKAGWNLELRKQLFEWFTRAKSYKGGASFSLFIDNMKKDALANTPSEVQEALEATITAEPPSEPAFTMAPRSFVQPWTVADFDDVVAVGLEGNRDYANGRQMFGAATCFACHRFGSEGGAIGPDLTSVAGKFSPRDLLESIIEPSKEVSDQYGQMIFEMNDGTVKMGRIMNLAGDSIRVNANMLDPNDIFSLDRKQLKSMKESPMSMMPPGLINTLSKDDVLDLLAYLLSMGNADDPMFEN